MSEPNTTASVTEVAVILHHRDGTSRRKWRDLSPELQAIWEQAAAVAIQHAREALAAMSAGGPNAR
jgi:hypothetical protein